MVFHKPILSRAYPRVKLCCTEETAIECADQRTYQKPKTKKLLVFKPNFRVTLNYFIDETIWNKKFASPHALEVRFANYSYWFERRHEIQTETNSAWCRVRKSANKWLNMHRLHFSKESWGRVTRWNFWHIFSRIHLAWEYVY